MAETGRTRIEYREFNATDPSRCPSHLEPSEESGLPEPQVAGVRKAIVRVAIETINAKSCALATLTEIAAALDLSDPAMYHDFPNKQALAQACHRHSLERFEHLLHAAREHGGTGEQKLRYLIRGVICQASATSCEVQLSAIQVQ